MSPEATLSARLIIRDDDVAVVVAAGRDHLPRNGLRACGLLEYGDATPDPVRVLEFDVVRPAPEARRDQANAQPWVTVEITSGVLHSFDAGANLFGGTLDARSQFGVGVVAVGGDQGVNQVGI